MSESRYRTWSPVFRRYYTYDTIEHYFAKDVKFGPRPNRRIRKWGTERRTRDRRNIYAIKQVMLLSSWRSFKSGLYRRLEHWYESDTRREIMKNGWSDGNLGGIDIEAILKARPDSKI